MKNPLLTATAAVATATGYKCAYYSPNHTGDNYPCQLETIDNISKYCADHQICQAPCCMEQKAPASPFCTSHKPVELI